MFLTARKPEKLKSRSFEDVIALLDAGNSGATESGVSVNTLSALQQPTARSCVRILSEIIAQLPIEIQLLESGQWVTSREHSLLELLAEPNDWQTQHDLISTLVAWSELKGNGYLYKIRNGAGAIKRVLPLESDNVDIQINSNWSLKYTVSHESGFNGVFGSDRVFHLRNFGSQGYKGLSTIENYKDGVALSLQLSKHASKAYKNGLQSNKWVSLEGGMPGETELQLFKSELRKFQGASNAGEIPVLSGAQVNEFNGVSLTDAEFVQLWKLLKEETATIFLVPVFLLNSTENTTWGSGLEQISRAFIRFALNPRLNRLGQTFVREFIPSDQRMKTRIVFDTDQFTLGEFKERMDGYRAGIESGVLNPNECREIEGRNSRKGGDEYRQPVNVATEGQNNGLQDPK